MPLLRRVRLLFFVSVLGPCAWALPELAATSLRTALEQDLCAFGELTSVLYVAAHPDDENTHLITYLARGRGYRTAYLSLTRGDGGQNESGPDFGEKLGLARTHELLVARRLDGGEQFFSRALDFGFSKDVNETLRIWDRREVLADTVRVIRIFRPDVVIARFSPEPGRTHGHHTAATVLALEAFALAGDPSAFPDQLTPAGGGLRPWQPVRLLHNNTSFRPRTEADGPLDPALLTLEAGGLDPVTGETFGAIAGRSRAMHVTQGFANYASRDSVTALRRLETFVPLAGAPAATDIFEGIEPSWKRYPGGAEIADLVASALATFDRTKPETLAPLLLRLRAKLVALPADPVVTAKRAQLDRLLQASIGLTVETRVANAEAVPGETLHVAHRPTVRTDLPVRWRSVRHPSLGVETPVDVPLRPDQSIGFATVSTLPAHTPPSQPYWLRLPGSAGLSQVADPALIGRPVDPPAFPVEYVFEIEGQTLVVADESVQVMSDVPSAQARRPLVVIPPVSLAFASEVELFAPGADKLVIVEVTAARPAAEGKLRLVLPPGWSATPPVRSFALVAGGESARLEFTVTAPAASDSADLHAVAELASGSYDQQRVVISYPHLPVLLLQPPARTRLVAHEIASAGGRVGYVPGAGDATAAALNQLGFSVTELTPAELTPETLRPLRAVVLGVRAFENLALAPHLPALFDYVAAGGTVVAQYNRPTSLKAAPLAPFALSIAGAAPALRVTDEEAAVTVLAPEHPALLAPNRIGPDDFAGWVQERGAYFASSWDEARFTPLIAMNDPGEAPLQGSLLVARHGKGYFVYTSLAFFRQLPAGVPGAYRLFANLVSLAP